MRLTSNIIKVERKLHAQIRRAKGVGIVCFADQESQFPDAHGGYIESEVNHITATAPVDRILAWCQTFEEGQVPEEVALPKVDVPFERDIETWDSLSSADARIRHRIDRANPGGRPPWRWTAESRTQMQRSRTPPRKMGHYS